MLGTFGGKTSAVFEKILQAVPLSSPSTGTNTYSQFVDPEKWRRVRDRDEDRAPLAPVGAVAGRTHGEWRSVDGNGRTEVLIFVRVGLKSVATGVAGSG